VNEIHARIAVLNRFAELGRPTYPSYALNLAQLGGFTFQICAKKPLSTKDTNGVLNDLKKENIQANTQSLTIVSTTELPKEVLQKAKPIELKTQ
jgi:hypothetical protein